MEQQKQTFENAADNAMCTLEETARDIDAAMFFLDQNKYNEMREKFVKEVMKKMEEKLTKVAKNKSNYWADLRNEERMIADMRLVCYPILEKGALYFDESIVEQFIRDIKTRTEWNNSLIINPYISKFLIGIIISQFGEIHEKKKRKEMEDADKNFSIPPLHVTLRQKDSTESDPFSYLGFLLPKSVSLTFVGDVPQAAGRSLRGGSLTITGDVGEWVGWDMTSGILNIEGEVGLFDKTAFSPKNLGTIIWRGITLWNNGWTKEGEEMMKEGKLPGIEPY